MSRLFNAYVMVDWSASQTPKVGKDSVWIGVMKRDIRFRLTFEAFNPATRQAAEVQLREIMADLRRRGDKALVGFDFNLGFPAGTAAALKLKDPTWAGLWAFLAKDLVDKADNTNNRFAVAAKMNRLMTDEPRPFWGAPPKDVQRWLQPTKAEVVSGDPAQLRRTELATAGLGKTSAKSVWQMTGAGAVGGQTLVGIPALKRFVDELGDKAVVWPFQTGWKALTPADVEDKEAVIAEVYPSLIPVKAEPGEVIDRAQVRALAEHFAKLDEAGKLGAVFAAKPGEDVEVVEREEGWILGA
ncbi:MAG: cobalamin biosynthesis protein CbiG [Caulobacterales bacterium 32-69-10]|nr:MAG: cobalamin biosynthesis protein CbiG [Caulobacterales bacterium 32-69-10]